MSKGDIGEEVSDHSQLEAWFQDDPLERTFLLIFYTKARFPYLYRVNKPGTYLVDCIMFNIFTLIYKVLISMWRKL